MRILLGGIPLGCDNIGDEAILAGVVRMMRETVPGVELAVATADPATAGLLGVEVVPPYGFAGVPAEGMREAARRLREELGLEGVELRERFVFEYRAESKETGLWEWEVDHVLDGTWDGDPGSLKVHPDEVDGVRWASPAAIDAELAKGGAAFTPWFREVWRRGNAGGAGR